VSSQQINKPLFIIGLPRTGTTKLFNLLSQDTLSRSPYFWEIINPCLPHSQAVFWANVDIFGINFCRPELKSMHHLEAEAPEECILIFAKNFMDLLLVSSKKMETYWDWWFSNDMTQQYKFHKKFIQLLHSERPARGHWLFKAPFHLCFLKELFEIYPDACIVQTHRDLRKAMGSVCSLNFTYNEFFEEKLNKSETSANLLKYWSHCMDACFKYRRSLPPEEEKKRFFDVNYVELQKDPIGIVKQIYTHFGYPIDTDFALRMSSWVRSNPQGKHGLHEYSLEEFGLTNEQVAKKFEDYKRHYPV